MIISITNMQEAYVTVQLVPPDSVIDGKLEWSTGNSRLVDLFPDEDGMGCVIRSKDNAPEGSTDVTAQGDADRGEGFKGIRASLELRIAAPDAEGLIFVPGDIRLKAV